MSIASPSGAGRRRFCSLILLALTWASCTREQPLPEGTKAATSAPAGAGAAAAVVAVPFADARALVLSASQNTLPPDLRGRSISEIEAAWPEWVIQRNASIRARLDRGDEDSLVNFWLYGTSFTTLPRATARDLERLVAQGKAAELLQARLVVLLDGLANPGDNERLQFARQVLLSRGIDPATPAGRDKAWDVLDAARNRVHAENERFRESALAAKRLTNREAELEVFSRIFRERGLSSDTSIAIDYALDEAVKAMKATGRVAPGAVRRLGIIGPGLDFTDKAEGFDFYPQQTIQPFALIDSLVRAGLSTLDGVRVTAFDVSPRVIQHLTASRARAGEGRPYVLQLPLDRDHPDHQWAPGLVGYWQRLGDQIGAEVPATTAPRGAGDIRVRAVGVRPAVVLAIAPQDLNVVVQRLEPSSLDEGFDIIVATNVLVYYDQFEQALALANIARMLKPGGFLVTNYLVSPSTLLEPTASLTTDVVWDRERNGDTIFWYQRR